MVLSKSELLRDELRCLLPKSSWLLETTWFARALLGRGQSPDLLTRRRKLKNFFGITDEYMFGCFFRPVETCMPPDVTVLK